MPPPKPLSPETRAKEEYRAVLEQRFLNGMKDGKFVIGEDTSHPEQNSVLESIMRDDFHMTFTREHEVSEGEGGIVTTYTIMREQHTPDQMNRPSWAGTVSAEYVEFAPPPPPPPNHPPAHILRTIDERLFEDSTEEVGRMIREGEVTEFIPMAREESRRGGKGCIVQ